MGPQVGKFCPRKCSLHKIKIVFSQGCIKHTEILIKDILFRLRCKKYLISAASIFINDKCLKNSFKVSQYVKANGVGWENFTRANHRFIKLIIDF